VPAGTSHLEISYSELRLASTAPPRFRFRLDGYDAGWVDAGARTTAYYSRVPPGSYTFRVVAASEDGAWTGEGAALALTVVPRFTETALFRGLVLLGIVLGVVAGHRLRVATLRRREAMLRARVDEALANVKILRGLLPICAWCKNVRDDSGYWQQIESYVRDHSGAEFSHGICPDCAEKYFPDEVASREKG
jgi:hypothetical protein